MDVRDTPAEARLREDVRHWLRENLPAAGGRRCASRRMRRRDQLSGWTGKSGFFVAAGPASPGRGNTVAVTPR